MAAPKKQSKVAQYQYLRTRQESFAKVALLGKYKKEVKWPLHGYDTDALSGFGFFYDPTLQHKDQIQCFYCHQKVHGLNGQTAEQISDEYECEYTELVRFAKNLGTSKVLQDPADPRGISARLKTFTNFPRAAPAPESIAAAGFIYTPSYAGDDSTTCIYCQCILSNWDKGDDPWSEHRASNAECDVFNAADKSAEPSEVGSPETKQAVPLPKMKNRYGSSKIKKTRIVTSSSAHGSMQPDSSAYVPRTSSQRRSWYRDDENKRSSFVGKKRSSDEFAQDDDVKQDGNQDVKKPRIYDDSSLMEISAIEDDPGTKDVAINGESLSNIIESTFAVPSRVASSPPPRARSPKQKPLPARRTRALKKSSPSTRVEGIVPKSNMLDALSASSEPVQQPVDGELFTEEIFDHLDENQAQTEVPVETADATAAANGGEDSAVVEEPGNKVDAEQAAEMQMDEKSIAEIISTENETIYAERRRTRSSMAPYSPPKPRKKRVEEELEEAEVESRRKSLVKRKASKKAAAKTATKSSKSKGRRPDKSRQSSDAASANDGSEPSPKASKNSKRVSLIKMIQERKSRLAADGLAAEVDQENKPAVKSKSKRKDSIFAISKSPGKSPLKLNKLIDADEEGGDIFSQGSPARPEAASKRSTNFGIDQIAAELGKDIFASEKAALRSVSPKLEKEDTPLLAPPSASPGSPFPVSSPHPQLQRSASPVVAESGRESAAEFGQDAPSSADSVAAASPLKTKPSRETLSQSTPLSSPPASKKSSQRASLRLSVLPAQGSQENLTVKSPISSARFEISQVDDDVILADDDILSGDASKGKLDVLDRDFVPDQEEEHITDEYRVPGVIAEFGDDDTGHEGESGLASPVKEHIQVQKTPNSASVQHLEPVKSSTPLNLMQVQAESTPLDAHPVVGGAVAADPEVTKVPEEEEQGDEGIQDQKAQDLQESNEHQKQKNESNQKDQDQDQGHGHDQDQDHDHDQKATLGETEPQWDSSEPTLLDQIITDIEASGDYFSKVTNSQYDSLNDDLDGELTNFIAQMPDEELEMTVKQWVVHNAKRARELLDMNLAQMVDVFKEKGESALQMLEGLPVKEGD